MATSFNKPPLIELIAELRWVITGIPKGNPLPNMAPPMVSGDNKLDEFFMRFGGAIYSDGFQNVERLVPQGFPFMAVSVTIDQTGGNPVCWPSGKIFTIEGTVITGLNLKAGILATPVLPT